MNGNRIAIGTIAAFTLSGSMACAQPVPPRYTVVPVPLDPNDTFSASVNGQGAITFQSGAILHGFLHRNGQTTELHSPDGGFLVPWGINASGTVVGVGSMQDPSGSVAWHAMMWSDGVATDLSPLGDWENSALGINAAGVITGYTTDSQHGTRRATIWTDGSASTLPLPTGASSSIGHKIASDGLVVGEANGSNGVRPVVWRDGAATWLPGSFTPGSTARAIFVADNGMIAGYEYLPTGNYRALVWINNEAVDVMPAGATESGITGITESGLVIGWSIPTTTNISSWVWRDGTRWNLWDLIDDPPQPPAFYAAQAVSPEGWILAARILQETSETTFVLLRPVPGPASSCALLAAGAAVLARRRRPR